MLYAWALWMVLSACCSLKHSVVKRPNVQNCRSDGVNTQGNRLNIGQTRINHLPMFSTIAAFEHPIATSHVERGCREWI